LTFNESYNRIRRFDNPDFSLVTKPRCEEIWNTIESIKNLEGDLIEVGVWRGGTGVLVAEQMKNLKIENKLYLCDTFTGVVKAGKEDKFYNNGEHADCNLNILQTLFNLYFRVPQSIYEVLSGIFPEETGKYVKDKKFRFVHLDVDVYQSTKDAFEFLLPNIVKNGIVIIDDYKWPNCTGITKFVDELIEQKRNDIEIKEGTAPYHAIIKKL
jgi:hypothetical protein